MTRLNGWQRIGVILSVLWIICGGFWGNDLGWVRRITLFGNIWHVWTTAAAPRISRFVTQRLSRTGTLRSRITGYMRH